MVINPAGYGHTSVAILDALKARRRSRWSNATCPTPPRARRSATRPMSPWPRPAWSSGFGAASYELAVEAAAGLAR